MSGKTERQIVSEKCRAVYELPGMQPLMQKICRIHQITIREFATIFGISKDYAENIIKHRKFPDLKLGITICRYFEVTVEDLFGWRIDDDGKRRPLIAIDLKTGKAYRLRESKREHETMNLVKESLGVSAEE